MSANVVDARYFRAWILKLDCSCSNAGSNLTVEVKIWVVCASFLSTKWEQNYHTVVGRSIWFETFKASETQWSIVVVQSLSHVQLCNPTDCSTPGFPVLHYLPGFAQIHVHWVSDAIEPSHLLLPFSFCCHSFPASGSFPMSRLFASGGQNIRSFSFIINPSSEYPGLIFFRIDSFDLLAVQGTLKSLLQHQNSKASILQCSTFFMVQLSHPCVTTGQKP